MIKKILLYTVGGIVGLVVLFMVWVVSIAPPAKHAVAVSEQKGHVDIHPQFKQLPIGLVVNNVNDPFGYQDIVMTINKDYTYKTPRLAKGGSIVAPWQEFVDSDGKRFSLLTTKVTNFQMTTITTNGDFGIIIKMSN